MYLISPTKSVTAFPNSSQEKPIGFLKFYSGVSSFPTWYNEIRRRVNREVNVVNRRIKAKIEAALGAGDGKAQSVEAPAKVHLATVHCIVDRLKAGENILTVKEIATRHKLSLSTIYRQFEGKLGCFKIGRKWCVTDSLYTQWLIDTVMRGASSN